MNKQNESIFKLNQSPSKLKAVNEFTNQMKSALDEARAALAKIKHDMARYYDRRRMPALTYQPGDKVYLDGSDIQTMRPSKKLAHRHLGPYVIECKVGPSAYKLKLPHSMSRLHPVFPVVKLIPAPPDPIPGHISRPLPYPILVHGEE